MPFNRPLAAAIELRTHGVDGALLHYVDGAYNCRLDRDRRDRHQRQPRPPRPPPFAVDLLMETLFRLKWAVKGLDRRRRRAIGRRKTPVPRRTMARP